MRVLIMDSYPLFREAIALQVAKVVERASIFEATTPEQVVALLDRVASFDLAIFCLGESESHHEWLRELKKRFIDLKIIVILENNQLFSHLCQQKEIDGFLTRSADIHEVKNALKLILMDEYYVSPSLLVAYPPLVIKGSQPTSNHPSHNLLTPRQLQVMKLIAAGFSNKSIANQLNCSDGTIKLHVSAILKEFNVHNRIGAIKYATKLGLISNN